jgi:O-antigen/teichoic acid export membrane protein
VNALNAKKRYLLAAQGAAANVLSRGAGLLLTLASVKWTIGYLGTERFGLWALVSSFTAMLSFLDLGIGNAMTNRIASVSAHGGHRALRTVIGPGLLVLVIVATLSAVALLVAAVYMPWSKLLRSTNQELLGEARETALVFALVFGLSVFSTGVQKVFLGLQRSAESNLALAVGTLCSCALVWYAAGLAAPVPVLLAATGASQMVAALVLLALLWHRRLICLSGVMQSVRLEGVLLVRAGGLFLLLQIGTMIGWGADSTIVGATLGAAQVAAFAVVQRLFSLASVPFAILNQPLWGAYADANARGDTVFIRRTLIAAVGVTAIGAAVLASALVVFHQRIIEWWTEDMIVVPLEFVVAYGVWAVIEAVAASAAMYMNGCNIIRPQVVAVVIFCALSIPLKVFLAGNYGLMGLVIGTVVSYLIAVPLLYWLFFRSEVMMPLRRSR